IHAAAGGEAHGTRDQRTASAARSPFSVVVKAHYEIAFVGHAIRKVDGLDHRPGGKPHGGGHVRNGGSSEVTVAVAIVHDQVSRCVGMKLIRMDVHVRLRYVAP